jgi:Mrp family chromosome partitioning ATPase
MRIRSSEHSVLDRPEEPIVAEVAGPGGGGPSARPRHPCLVTLSEPDHPIARLVRNVRLSLSAQQDPEDPPVRSVAVIGVGEGTAQEASAIAANLALTYAQGGTTTVLVDANLDRPTQHLFFDGADGGGLAAVGPTVDIRQQVRPAGTANLALLAGGPLSASLPHLMDGQQFHRRILPLLESYSLMVVDIGAPFGEPPAICEAVDAAVLIVRRDRTGVEQVEKLTQRLEQMSVQVAGTILVQ